MSASKYFYKAVGSLTCSDLIHVNGEKTCLEAIHWNLTQTIAGCCKYVLPIAAIPLVLKFRRLDRHVLRESASIFVEYSFAAWLMGAFGLSFICLFYRVLGRFYYSTVLAIPTFCSSGICALLMSDKLISLFAHGLFTMAVEVSIARGDTFICRAVRDSTRWRTLGFMTVNMFLLNALKQSARGSKLWFLRPARNDKKNNTLDYNSNHPSTNSPLYKDNVSSQPDACSSCGHSKCETYIFDEMVKYMKLGLGVEIVRALIGNIIQLRTNPVKCILQLPGMIDCKLTAFLITYAGLYRYINCSLTRQTCISPKAIHSLSAFASGIAFIVYPNGQMLAHTLATTVEVSWRNFEENTHSSDCSSLWKKLVNFPIARCFYPMAFAYLLHIRVFYPWLAPSVLKNLMNLTTNFKDNQIMARYYEQLFNISKV